MTIAVNRNLNNCKNIPLKARKTFFSGYFRNCLNCDSLRWSHTHFICIPAVHIISFILKATDYSRGAFKANQNITAIPPWPSQPMGYFSSSQRTKKDGIWGVSWQALSPFPLACTPRAFRVAFPSLFQAFR